MRRALVCLLLLAGCGSAAAPPDAAGPGATADAAVDATNTADTQAPVDLAPDLAPLPPASLRRLLPANARLAGNGATTCSHGVQAAPADVWCAFTRTIEGADADPPVELWVMNVSRALAEPVACDGSSPQCRRLSAALWTGGALGGPLYPIDDGFDGDTLIFYAGGISTKPDGVYQGPVWAWRPGWAEARQISTDKGLLCFGHERAAVAYCVENVLPGPPVTFDIRAGALVDGPNALPLMAAGIHPWKGSEIAWHAEFSPDGAQFAISAVEPSTDGEVLQVSATAELGQAAPHELAYDATGWRISLDGQKIYYLQGFSSEPTPAGKLMMADFPTGAHPTLLQEGVASFQLLGEPGVVDRGLGFFQDMSAGLGNFRVLADRAHPEQVTTVVEKIDDVGPSPDGRFVLYEREDAMGYVRTYLARSDGTGTPCMLNTLAEGEVFGLHFLDDARLVFWSEIDMTSNDGVPQGWVARSDGCADKQKYADKSSFVLTVADKVAVYGHNKPDEIRYTLEHAHIGAGTPPLSMPTLIRDQTDATIAAVPVDRGVQLLVQVPDGHADQQGVYLYGPIAF